jgi:hypothetical protein
MPRGVEHRSNDYLFALDREFRKSLVKGSGQDNASECSGLVVAGS